MPTPAAPICRSIAPLLWAALCALPAGCGTLRLNQQRLDEGLTIVLPGIDGRGASIDNVCQTLAGLDIPTAVELHDWTVPGTTVLNQCAMRRNREFAAGLAAYVVDYRRAHPGRPVYLVGHSGGTAIAVWTAEAMPPGETLDGVILLASSLSPGYDLSGALAATRQLVNYYSPNDTAILGAGCSAIGTMDRRHTPAAGLVGFDAQHPRLLQIPYDAAMAREGLDGSHFFYCTTGFVTAHLASHLRPAGDALAALPPTRRPLDPCMETPPFKDLQVGQVVALK